MPGRLTSNLPAVARATSDLGQALNLRRRAPGGRRLGDEAVSVMAAGIQRRVLEQQLDANGKPLAPLARRYALLKARRGLDPRVAVATGETTSLEELEGRATVTKNAAIVDVGKSEEVREKLEWLAEGDHARNRKQRPIVGIDKPTEKDLDALANETVDAAVKAAGR